MSTRVNPIRLFVTHAGRRTTTTRVCSNISRRRELSITSTPVSRRRNGPSTKRASAKTCAGKSLPARSSSLCRQRSGGARIGAVSNDVCESRGSSRSSRWRISAPREPLAESHQGFGRRGERVERAQFDRCPAAPGAPSRNDALGYDRIQARLIGLIGRAARPLVAGDERRELRIPRLRIRRCAIAPPRRSGERCWRRRGTSVRRSPR